jgi:hypothetical protein
VETSIITETLLARANAVALDSAAPELPGGSSSGCRQRGGAYPHPRGGAIPNAKVQERKTKVQKPATIRDFWT